MNLQSKKQSFFIKSTKLLIFVFSLVLAGGVLAQTWTPPPSDPPGGNTPAPINVSNVGQAKDGTLGLVRLNALRAFFPRLVGSTVNFEGGQIGNMLQGFSITNVLDIVGGGNVSGDRKVKVWDDLEVGDDLTVNGDIIGGATSQFCTGDGSCLDFTDIINGTTLPGGGLNQTLRRGPTGWEAAGNLINTGSSIGIGLATLPNAQLHTSGDVRFMGVANQSASTHTRLLTMDNQGLLGWKDQSSVPGGGGVGPFPAGQILFGNGSASPVINTSGGLFWNNTNSRLGIGTTNPLAPLHIAGNAIVGSSGDGILYVAGSSGAVRDIRFTSGNSPASQSNWRWFLRTSNDAESGSNAGSSFILNARNDSGGPIDNVFTVSRQAGSPFTINRPVSVPNGLLVGSLVNLNEGGNTAVPKVLIVNTDTSTAGNAFPQGLHVRNDGRGWAIFAEATGAIQNGLRVKADGTALWAEGPVRLSAGNPGPNKILVSTDAGGSATWKTLTEVIEGEPDDGEPTPGGSGDYLQASFSLCNTLFCSIREPLLMSPQITATISLDLVFGHMVRMHCPAGYRVISGGVRCIPSFVGIPGTTAQSSNNVGIDRPLDSNTWEVQCRSGVGIAGLDLGTFTLPSSIGKASIICAKI